MDPRLPKLVAAVLAGGLAVAGAPGVASAHPGTGGVTRTIDDRADARDAGQQHGGSDGHLPATSAGVELVGKAAVQSPSPGLIADVTAYGKTAYLASQGNEDCQRGGVFVMDISDPTKPRQSGFIPAQPGNFVGEGMQVINLSTSAYRGPVLIHNNEVCDPEAPGGKGGLTLVGVGNPASPVMLAENVGDTTNEFDPDSSNVHQIHSAFAWQAGGKAYAVLVDDEEFSDVDIMDISDPRKPIFIAEYDLNTKFGVAQEQLGDTSSFLHDMVVKEIGGVQVMLLSYWDGGFVQLDVDDPTDVKLINQTDFTVPDPERAKRGEDVLPEGNGHQAEFTRGNRYFIGTDEDFAPFQAGTFTITTGPNAGEFPAVSVGGGGTAAALEDNIINGPVVYGGYGCPDSAPVPSADTALADVALEPGEEKIVVLQRGPSDDPGAPEEACFPGDKAASAVAAGYDAVVIVNRHNGSAADDEAFCGSGGFPEGDAIPTVCTTHEAFHRLFDSPPAFDLPYQPGTEPVLGAVGAKVTVTARFDGWGYVHLFDRETGKELDTFSIPEAQDEQFGEGFGDLSVHEVATDPGRNLAYLSYYGGGFRVLSYGPNGLKQVGRFIDEGGNNFWGVESHYIPGFGKVVLASDRDYGLYIFRVPQFAGGSQPE